MGPRRKRQYGDSTIGKRMRKKINLKKLQAAREKKKLEKNKEGEHCDEDQNISSQDGTSSDITDITTSVNPIQNVDDNENTAIIRDVQCEIPIELDKHDDSKEIEQMGRQLRKRPKSENYYQCVKQQVSVKRRNINKKELERARQILKESREELKNSSSVEDSKGSHPYQETSSRVESNGVFEIESNKVESTVGTHAYRPTLWYYEHLNFLSDGKAEESNDDQSESENEDDNNETIEIQVPADQKNQASQSNTSPIVEASAAAFGNSVGAQLQHLSKVQRCIAEKLISDIIYHGKMEHLTMNSSVNLNIERSTVSQDQCMEDNNIVIPKTEPSWYDSAHGDSSQQESSSSCTLLPNADMAKEIDQETQSAVNCIKFELEESHDCQTTFHIMQDDLAST